MKDLNRQLKRVSVLMLTFLFDVVV